jgi:hypothetical protein
VKRLFIVVTVLFCWSLIRAAPIVPDPVRLIDASGVEILLYAPVMRDREQARALRRAVVERGVRVTILSEPESAREASSYLPSLKLAGAGVFVARVPRGERGLLIVDGRVAVSGVGLGRLSLPYEGGLRFEATSNIPALNAWFLNSIRSARALSVSSLIGR